MGRVTDIIAVKIRRQLALVSCQLDLATVMQLRFDVLTASSTRRLLVLARLHVEAFECAVRHGTDLRVAERLVRSELAGVGHLLNSPLDFEGRAFDDLHAAYKSAAADSA